jgi:hypothetical protein
VPNARRPVVGCGFAILFGAALAGCETPVEPPSGSCQYVAAPAAVATCMPATEMAVTLSTAPGCSWTAAPTAPWIALTAGSSGRGPNTIRFGVSENWDAPRTAGVTIRDVLAGPVAEVQVSQAGCRYWVSQAAFDVGSAGGTQTFDVLQQSEPTFCGGPRQNACRWSAESGAAWITILTPMPRQGDDRVSFSVAPNTGGPTRAGTITVRDQEVAITQAGTP